MADDDSSNVLDTERRFEIYVPSPKARINLGAPNLTSSDEGPFGYTGLSLQSDVHLFIDANKHTLFQTGQSYCGQVGGKWHQYSNSDMIISSTANANFSADKKIVIASGAGQGQITALDHGVFPRVVGYNGLGLSYTVDKIQSSLFEFFHGRRKHDSPNAFLKLLQAGDYFDSSGDGTTDLATAVDPTLAGGFIETSALSLRDLYPVAQKRAVDKHEDAVTEDGDPVALLDGLVAFGVVKAKGAELKYGFTKYVNRFDPYALIDTSDPDMTFLAKKLAGFKNIMAKLRRFADVVMKYADLLTNNVLMRLAISALDAMNGLMSATFNLYNAFGPSGSISSLPDHFADEAGSGWGARLKGTEGLGDMGENADAAAATVENEQASVQTARGPWDLSRATLAQRTMVLTWDGGTTTVVVSDQATPAVLSVGVGALAAAGPATLSIAAGGIATKTGTVIIEINGTELTTTFTGANNADAGAVIAAITATVGAMATVSATGDTLTITTRARGASQHLEVRYTGALDTLPAQVADGVAEERGDLVLSLSGTVASVHFDPTNTASASAVRGALGAFGGCSVTGDGRITMTTTATGAGAFIEVLPASSAEVLSKLKLSSGQRAVGAAPIDLSAVSAAQIGALIQASGVSTSTSREQLTVKSDKQGGGSKVAASGALADKIFDTSPKSDEVTHWDAGIVNQGLAKGRSGYTQLISWNHEIQKLPEDTRNLMRPVRNALNDCVAAVGALESATSVLNEFMPEDKALPSPPEAIGLFANDGITLGSQDRIVGSGGKGIVFIADGSSSTEDHAKFIPGAESFVNAVMGFKFLKLFQKDDPNDIPKHPESLGFRVLSDSTVDLMGSNSAQLMALGRGKLNAKDAEDREVAGIGIARVAGSYATEVAGYRKVVISARSPGKAGTDGSGGRVELAGQTITVGGMNLAQDIEDFLDTGGIGIEPPDVAKFSNTGHLADATVAGVAQDTKAYGWSETLRKGGATGHPNTEFVRIHAEKEATMVVGSYMLHLTTKDGYALGTRTKDKDPTKNVVDTTKPYFLITDKAIELQQEQDKGALLIDGTQVLLNQAKDGSQLLLEANKATLMAKKDDAMLALKASAITLDDGGGNGMFVSNSNVEMFASGAFKVNGQTIKLG